MSYIERRMRNNHSWSYIIPRITSSIYINKWSLILKCLQWPRLDQKPIFLYSYIHVSRYTLRILVPYWCHSRSSLRCQWCVSVIHMYFVYVKVPSGSCQELQVLTSPTEPTHKRNIFTSLVGRLCLHDSRLHLIRLE